MKTLAEWTVEHRAQLAVLVCGFVGLYLLIRRASVPLRLLGIVLAATALVVLAFNLQPPGVTLHGLLFYLFSATALTAAASTVTQQNPVYSALSFALVTLSVCGLFLLRGAEFLAAATVIIYAGAIVVTFLFIMMLARQSGNANYDRHAHEPFLSTLASFLLLGVLLFVIEDWAVARRVSGATVPAPAGRLTIAETAAAGPRNLVGFVRVPHELNPHPASNVVANENSRLRGLGRTLFSDYLIAVELAGTLLLIAAIGAVAIAPRRRKGNA